MEDVSVAFCFGGLRAKKAAAASRTGLCLAADFCFSRGNTQGWPHWVMGSGHVQRDQKLPNDFATCPCRAAVPPAAYRARVAPCPCQPSKLHFGSILAVLTGVCGTLLQFNLRPLMTNAGLRLLNTLSSNCPKCLNDAPVPPALLRLLPPPRPRRLPLAGLCRLGHPQRHVRYLRGVYLAPP